MNVESANVIQENTENLVNVMPLLELDLTKQTVKSKIIVKIIH